MALLKDLPNTGNHRTENCGYWIVESVHYDKQTGKTSIDVGGYENQATRMAMFPTAESRRRYEAEGSLDVAGCYEHLKSLEEDFDQSVDG